MTLADVTRPLLAVLIDADNTSPRYAGAIFEEIAGLGEASVRRCYGDFSSQQMSGWSKVQAEHGIVPQHSPAPCFTCSPVLEHLRAEVSPQAVSAVCDRCSPSVGVPLPPCSANSGPLCPSAPQPGRVGNG